MNILGIITDTFLKVLEFLMRLILRELCKKKLFCYKKNLGISFLLHQEKPQSI